MTVTDPVTLSAFLSWWERDREPPEPLIDFLLEQGDENGAEVVRRVLASERRKSFEPVLSERSLPFPAVYGDNDVVWYWSSFGLDYCDQLLRTKLDLHNQQLSSVREALLWLLTQPPEVIPQ